MKTIRKLISVFLVLLFLMVTGCENSSDNKSHDEVINILYTTDVHCGISDKIGYSSLSAYKKALEEKNENVTLVDCGDAIQGDFIGAISKGAFIIELMNEVGYDLFTLGNHEFDYGMDELQKRLAEFNGDVLSCNISYIGSGENKLSEVKPYKIIEYGTKKVAYIGITTPTTLTSSNPSHFKEDDEYAYTFGEKSPKYFYDLIQNNIDECKSLGADYVILMTHLGYGDIYRGFGSIEVAQNTSGADVILDGHSHKDIICEYFLNKDNKYVPLCGAGYKMNEFGRIMISENGEITVGLVSRYEEKDPIIENKITEINEKINAASRVVLANSNMALSITDAAGIRIVRNSETPIGNMVADAYRTAGRADIGFANGGGIRDSLPSGDLTYQNMMKLNPFGNVIMTIKATGAQILDYLEFSSRQTKANYQENGKAVGENGGFANVSGLKYTIDTTIASSIVLDEKGNFASVGGQYRVRDVYVLENGEYVPLELDKTYVIASHNFLFLEGGDGANMFMDCEIVQKDIMLDYEAIVNYIVNVLHGDIASKYSTTEGRINIE